MTRSIRFTFMRLTFMRLLEEKNRYILLHRSDLKISANNRQHFSRMNIEFPIVFHFLRRILHFSAIFFLLVSKTSRQRD